MAGELEVRQDLCKVDRQHDIDCLQLDHDAVAREDVNPETWFDPQSLVLDGHGGLALNLDSSHLKFTDETALVDRLQQPWPKLRMNGERRIHHVRRDDLDS